MVELMVPKHLARSRASAPSSPLPSFPIPTAADDETSVTIYSVDRPLPAVVPAKVHPYRMYVMLVGLKNISTGGIILPDDHIDAQYYNHCLGRIVAMGQCCFRGQRWEDIGYAPDMGPKVGDFITFNPRSPIRETWSDTVLLIMNDDDWRSSPTRAEIDHLKAGF